MLLSLIQWTFVLAVAGLVVGVQFSSAWALGAGLLLIGFVPPLLFANLFCGRRD